MDPLKFTWNNQLFYSVHFMQVNAILNSLLITEHRENDKIINNTKNM